jgi:hypothetical protein
VAIRIRVGAAGGPRPACAAAHGADRWLLASLLLFGIAWSLAYTESRAQRWRRA